jgi:hypothetical protein
MRNHQNSSQPKKKQTKFSIIHLSPDIQFKFDSTTDFLILHTHHIDDKTQFVYPFIIRFDPIEQGQSVAQLV